MKKFLCFTLSLCLLLPTLFLTSCKKEETLELNVYNWEDYIACDDYDMVAEFENYYYETYGQKVVVNYSTFGTNENMYNELKLTQKKDGAYSYDLVCPSEYMIQKMITEDMLETFDYSKVPNYENNVANYIKDLFDKNDWNDYALCFNWGTMGFTYNPEIDSLKEDVKSWSVVTNEKYKNKITIKDSVRDSYVLALGYVNGNKLLNLDKNAQNYNEQVHSLLNDFSDEAIEKSRVFLSDLRQNLYGFEVDSGKQDMATGKIWINFAWSGDAVYAMDIAEEEGTYLEYAVPKEGSNIFFDGWVMPKGANKELAQIFLNFMYREDNAKENLAYICYSSPIVGEEIFSFVCDTYGLTTFTEVDYESDYLLGGKYYDYVYVGNMSDFNGQSTYSVAYYDESEEEIVTEEVEVFGFSVKHFFEDSIEGDGIIYTDSLDRQLVAMYPTRETMNRCVVMEHLETETLKKLNNMWDSVKVGYMPYYVMLLIVVGIILISAGIVVIIVLKKKGKELTRKKKDYGVLVNSEKIN